MFSKDREKTKRLVSLLLRLDLSLETIKKDALEILADMLEKYISGLAYYSIKYAEHASRKQPNLFDVLISLDKVGLFSVSIKDLLKYLKKHKKQLKKLPFTSNRIAEFILPQEIPQVIDLLQIREATQTAIPEYIPKHFPLFPPVHTYSRTVCTGKREDKQSLLVLKKEEEQRILEKDVCILLENIDKIRDKIRE